MIESAPAHDLSASQKLDKLLNEYGNLISLIMNFITTLKPTSRDVCFPQFF